MSWIKYWGGLDGMNRKSFMNGGKREGAIIESWETNFDGKWQGRTQSTRMVYLLKTIEMMDEIQMWSDIHTKLGQKP